MQWLPELVESPRDVKITEALMFVPCSQAYTENATLTGAMGRGSRRIRGKQDQTADFQYCASSSFSTFHYLFFPVLLQGRVPDLPHSEAPPLGCALSVPVPHQGEMNGDIFSGHVGADRCHQRARRPDLPQLASIPSDGKGTPPASG